MFPDGRVAAETFGVQQTPVGGQVAQPAADADVADVVDGRLGAQRAAFLKPNGAQQRCLQLLKSRGVVPKGSLDFKIAYTTCEVLFILERGLRASGGSSDGPTLVRGVQGIGTSFESASKLAGAAAFGADRNDALLSARPLVWVDACKCYDYTGSIRDIPAR